MKLIMCLIAFHAIMTVGVDWAINYQQDLYRIILVYIPGILGSIGIILYMNIRLRLDEIADHIDKSKKARIDYAMVTKTCHNYGRKLMVFLVAIYILWVIEMIVVNIIGMV
mgnify:FL=1